MFSYCKEGGKLGRNRESARRSERRRESEADLAYQEGLEAASRGGRRLGFARRYRRREETTIEIACFAIIIMAFMIVVAFNLVSPLIPGSLCLVTGAVLLAGAVFQWQRRFRVNPMTWMGGFAAGVGS